QPVIIAEMPHEIATLTVSQAVMHMDLSDLPLTLFRNRAHGGINVVYRRADGNIGWIDPNENQQTKSS
ncbi:MAG: sigma 54 modulation/S30EA ribosomal C-terminal domain-containing protein, partial [Rhodospirillales bacterium]